MIKRSLIIFLFLLGTAAEAKNKKKVPLSTRMNCFCAVTYSYPTSPNRPTEAVKMFRKAGIKVKRGDRDALGNYVAKFGSAKDGRRACFILLKSDLYRHLDLLPAMKRFAGPGDGLNYALYIHQRAGLPLSGRPLASFNNTEWRKFEIAQTEFENGHHKKGLIRLPVARKKSHHQHK